MNNYYLAVTYDVCEHNNLCIDMNQYRIDPSKDIDEQIKQWAKVDVAPLVKVFSSDTSAFKEFTLYKEYIFKEFECGCNDNASQS